MYARSAMTLLVALLLTCTLPVQAEEPNTDGMLIHISAGPDDPHRVLMALRMAELMAESHPTLIYMDIDAVHVVLADAEPLEFKPFPNSDVLLGKLIDAGVRIMACPSCLEAAGKNPEQLREGVSVADKSAFFSFTSGRIVTLDY